MKDRYFSLLTQYWDSCTSLIESDLDNDNGEGSLMFDEINGWIDVGCMCDQFTNSIVNDEKFLTFHISLWKCLEAIPEVRFFVCFLCLLFF